MRVDFGRQNRVVPTDHRRVAEIGDRDCKADESRVEDPEARRGQGQIAKLARRRSAHDFRSFVNARVQQDQRRPDNHHRLRQGIKRVGDQQPPEAVDFDLDTQGTADDAVASQKEDQPKSLHERGGQQRQDDHAADQPLAPESAAIKPMRDDETKEDAENCGGSPHDQGMFGRAPEPRRPQNPRVVGKPVTIVNRQGTQEHDHHRVEKEEDEPNQWQPNANKCQQPVRIQLPARRRGHRFHTAHAAFSAGLWVMSSATQVQASGGMLRFTRSPS